MLASFAEIRALLGELPLTTIPANKAIHHPRIALFAGTHGIAGPDGMAGTKAAVAACLGGSGAVNPLCETADADLRVYELALDYPTADFTQSPAMSEEACARAMAYGMMAVEPGIDLLGLGALSMGGLLAAAAIAHALFGGTASDWTAKDTPALETAITLHFAATPVPQRDPLEVLRCLGGHELAALCGAIIAARLARQPVLLDGYGATAVAAILFRIDARLIGHCRAAQVSAVPGHALLQNRLGQKPVLGTAPMPEEGVGAALAIPLLQAA